MPPVMSRNRDGDDTIITSVPSAEERAKLEELAVEVGRKLADLAEEP